MKTIGLIGGMSWESSKIYYELLNQKVKEKLGGHHSAKCLMYSVDFGEIEELQRKEDWKSLNILMANAAVNLERGSAEIILLCTNTMHLCSPAIRNAISIPFLHIATATGKAISNESINKVGLLGTKFTMEKDFYKHELSSQFDIETIIPEDEERDEIHRIIYEELVHGKFTKKAQDYHKLVIRNLQNRGAQGIILGCTEIPILMKGETLDIPLFDTTAIHVEEALKWALAD